MSASQNAKDAAFRVARKEIDDSGYGFMVSDDKVRGLVGPIADAVAQVVVSEHKTADAPVNPKQPLSPK